MPRARKITKSLVSKIHELQGKELSDIMIARALGISEDSVKKFKNKEVVKDGSVKTNESEKTDRERRRNRNADPGKSQDKRREPERNIGGNDPVEKINFVGGKTKMSSKKTEEEVEDGTIYQCYNCDHSDDEPFGKCPKCGAVNTW